MESSNISSIHEIPSAYGASQSHFQFLSSIRILQQALENFPPPPPMATSSSASFPILAIALLAIMVTAFLLVSYYIITIRCCLNWQPLVPLRRFSFSRARGGSNLQPRYLQEESWMAYPSPNFEINRGLEEWVIRGIPTMRYKGNGSISGRSCTGDVSFRGCSVCLSRFEEQEVLRVLPHCGHFFHLDCIDIWLMNNANCPLCRSNISGRKQYSLQQIVAPSSSPQETTLYPGWSHRVGGGSPVEEDYVVVEVGGGAETNVVSRVQSSLGHSQRKKKVMMMVAEQKGGSINNKKSRVSSHHASIMGDECIDVRQKDERFEFNQPMRRSFSMDSAVDQQLYLQVQQIVRQNRNNNRQISTDEVSSSSSRGESSDRWIRRSLFFSFGHGRSGSKSSVLPIGSHP